jgi:hypothetical protein
VYVWVCGGRGVRMGVRRQGCTCGCAEAGVYVWVCGGRGVRMVVRRQGCTYGCAEAGVRRIRRCVLRHMHVSSSSYDTCGGVFSSNPKS